MHHRSVGPSPDTSTSFAHRPEDLPVLDGVPVSVSCERGHVYRGTCHWFHFPSPDQHFHGLGVILELAPGATCHHERLVTPPACPDCGAQPVHLHQGSLLFASGGVE